MSTTVPPGGWRNPIPTVDVLIRIADGLVLIRRANVPLGWAIPGGFVDEGEKVEAAAVREAAEETGLNVELKELFYVYSDPRRDPRKHTLSVVFTAVAEGTPGGQDDASEARIVSLQALRVLLAAEKPEFDGLPIVFDHPQILMDYLSFLDNGLRPTPFSGAGGRG